MSNERCRTVYTIEDAARRIRAAEKADDAYAQRIALAYEAGDDDAFDAPAPDNRDRLIR